MFTNLEDTEGDGLVDRHGGADTHPDGVEGADEEDGGGHGAAEGVLELVDGLQEGHGDETDGHRGHGEHAEELVGDHAERVEGGEEVPLGENLEGGGEGVGGLTELGGLHDREADAARDGTEDHDREDVEEVVGPRGRFPPSLTRWRRRARAPATASFAFEKTHKPHLAT